MSVREFLEKNGWGFKAPKEHRFMTVRIYFLNQNKMDDEVEFDIPAYDTDDLEELFETFCQENDFSTDTVTDIYVVESAGSMEILQGATMEEILEEL